MTATWEKPDPYIRIAAIYINRESAETVRKICKREGFCLYEDGVIWLIKRWAQCGEIRDFTWSFNTCVRPKYWFGDRVLFQNRKGAVFGMEWKDDTTQDMKRGWWYKCQFVAPCRVQSLHEDELCSFSPATE